MIKALAKLNYRFLDGIRHKDAFRAARERGSATDFAAMRGHHYALVVSFKQSGEPVPTPVLFALDGRKVVFRTEEGVAKVKRIQANPRVRVGPCNLRGKPLGPLTEGEAMFLSGEEAHAAHAALRRSYTVPMGISEGAIDRLPIDLVYVEVTPVATTSSEAGR